MKQTSKYIQKALNTEKSLRIADNVAVQNHTKSSVKMKIETTKIGCWNVKSMGKPTKFSIKLINVIATMREKNLSLLAMSEVRWAGSGTLEIEGTAVLYSGLSEPKNGNQRRVAIALRGDLRKAWKKEGTHSMISERVIKARINFEDKHINFIAVYAPPEVDDEEESENFYETLQDQLARINKKKHVIVLGDFNARVGPLENPSRLHTKMKPSTNLKSLDGRQTLFLSEDKIIRWKELFASAASSDSTVDTTAYSELLPPIITLDDEEVADLSKPLSIVELTNALKQCKLETPNYDVNQK